jgi:hypothetical protein
MWMVSNIWGSSWNVTRLVLEAVGILVLQHAFGHDAVILSGFGAGRG